MSGDKLTLKSTYLEKIVLSERIELEFSAEAKLGFAVTSNKVFLVDFDGRGVPEKGFGIGFATKETAGKDGNGYNLVNTGTASFLTLGGVFYPLTFEAGVSYTFEFDLEINDIDFTNFVIAGNSCFMPVTFGSGKDVTYIRLSDDGKGGVMVANENAAARHRVQRSRKGGGRVLSHLVQLCAYGGLHHPDFRRVDGVRYHRR